MTKQPQSIVFSWLEARDGLVVRVRRALRIGYLFDADLSLQDTSLGREILAKMKREASPNIQFSSKDAYDINRPEEQ